MQNVSMEGLLTDDQLFQIGRMTAGLININEAITRLNDFARETGLPIREIPNFTLGQFRNDLTQILFTHELAEKRVAAAAWAQVEQRRAA